MEFVNSLEYSAQGRSESVDDIISVSSVNGNYAPKSKNKKSLKTVRSYRRRIKPIITQPSVETPDSSVDGFESSPNYLKPTSSSEGKKEQMGFLLRRASFKPKRPLVDKSRLFKDVRVDRATYSSIVKDSKFPKPVEHYQGSEKLSKVCRYHHCSLHGHCHGNNNDSVTAPKRFLYKRRSLLKKQKSVIPKRESWLGTKRAIINRKNLQKNEMISLNEPVVEEICAEPRDGIFGVEYSDIQEYLVEIVFGETSLPERSYQETLNIMSKYSPQDGDDLVGTASRLPGYCLKCFCKIREQISAPPDLSIDPKTASIHEVPLNGNSQDKFSLPVLENKKEQVSSLVEESETIIDREDPENEEFRKDLPEPPVIFDSITKSNTVFSSTSNSRTLSGNNSDGDTKESIEEIQVKDSEINSSILGGKLQFSKQRHVSMWHLIHQRMSSDLASEDIKTPHFSVASPNPEKESNGSDVEELEIRKLFAIKLVREAIEKILLPEIQDQTSDDQSCENTPRPELLQKDQSDAFIKQSCGEYADKEESKVQSNIKEESLTADISSGQDITKTGKTVPHISQKKAPKHWSNLKKWILLQRFIKALEKVRKFNPKQPNLLPLNPDPEAEKVKLRTQTVDERKKSEEWMLDYALRQAVSQLVPTQKKKVALLVKAFETVVPSQDEPQIQVKTPRLKENSLEKENGKNKEVIGSVSEDCEKHKDVPFDKKAKLDIYDAVSNLDLVKQESEERNTIESSKVSVTEPYDENKARDSDAVSDRQNNVKMWHMIYQHVASGIAEKVGSKILYASDDEEAEENKSTNQKSGFTKKDALKLVKDAVDEILLPDIPEEKNSNKHIVESPIKNVFEPQNSKNWTKLKKIILLKRSIGALQFARKLKPQGRSVFPENPDSERERIDLRNQMMDERNKAEQWMLDYAVQHIVGKLTPSRKRRVAMLVEAFEAVVPLPEM